MPKVRKTPTPRPVCALCCLNAAVVNDINPPHHSSANLIVCATCVGTNAPEMLHAAAGHDVADRDGNATVSTALLRTAVMLRVRTYGRDDDTPACDGCGLRDSRYARMPVCTRHLVTCRLSGAEKER